MSLRQYRNEPVFQQRDELLSLSRNHQIVVLEAPTGTGKSTAAPHVFLREELRAGRKMIVATPLKQTAIDLATWVAQVDETVLGERIGYQVGGDKCVDRDTQLIYMTYGVLLGRLQRDPELSGVDFVFIDEFHDRKIEQDFSLELIRQLTMTRQDLKVILMSATIDAASTSEYLGGAPVLKVDGRRFPVQVVYADESPLTLRQTIRMAGTCVREILDRKESGDILVFMPDQESIHLTIDALRAALKGSSEQVKLLPFYGQQTGESRREVFEKGDLRRVIVATNAAESGLTISGLKIVVDSGLVKQETANDLLGVSALQITENSKSSCLQRMGRCGREAPGTCYRLFTERDFQKRPAFNLPEIKRTSLTKTLLDLLCFGYSYEQILALKFKDTPEQSKWEDARSKLLLLGVIDVDNHVTSDGVRMHELRADPMAARMILTAQQLGCLDPVLTIAAGIAAPTHLFARPDDEADKADLAHEKFKVPGSDPLTILKVYEAWIAADRDPKWAFKNFISTKALSQIEGLRAQFVRSLSRHGQLPETTSVKTEDISRAIASGLIVHVAVRTMRYEFSYKGRTTHIFPGSSAFGTNPPECVVCTKVRESGRSDGYKKTYMLGVHAIPKAWIRDLIPPESLTTSWEIERPWFGTGVYGSGFKMWRITRWDHLEIERVEVTEWDQSALEVLVPHIMGGFNGSRTGLSVSSWHQAFYGMLISVLGWSDDLLDRMIAKVAERIANVRSLSDLYATDLKFDPEDFLTPDQLDAFKDRLQQLQRSQTQADQEAQQRAEASEERRLAELEERTQFSRRFAELEQIRQRLGVEFRYDWHAGSKYSVRNDAEAAGNGRSWRTIEQDRESMEAYERLIQREETLAAPKYEATIQVYDDVAALMPTCPVCGLEWNTSGVCTQTHDSRRFIPVSGTSVSGIIGRFMTNRGEEVARILIAGRSTLKVEFSVEEDTPWKGKRFSTISYEPLQAILPESLVADRDDIIELLHEIKVKYEALAKFQQELIQLQASYTNGTMVGVLRFDSVTSSGYLEGKTDRTSYRAMWESGGPEVGETWLCELTRPKGLAVMALDAKPLRKLTGPTSHEDIQTSVAEIRELFDNQLPEELLG